MSADDTMMRLLEDASAQSAEVLSPAAAWRDRAACRGLHPDLFYPPTTAEQERVAAQYCAECSARFSCLAYALTRDEMHGVWGGTSEQTRRALRRVRRRQRENAERIAVEAAASGRSGAA